MHHVVGIGGIVAGEAAEQRDEAHAPGVEARQLLDRGGERPPVAEADHPVLAALDLAPEEAGAGDAERAQRQAVLAEVGRHLAEVEPEARGEPRLELDAFDDVAVDA